MATRRILILGGTGDARRLAVRLVDDGHHIISSLAGVTSDPAIPVGLVRIGGFGGAEGLANYISMERIDVLIDATHPFAAQISENGAEAAKESNLPYVRFERPAWQVEAGDQWISAASTEDAVGKLEPKACAFVTIGRKEIGWFTTRQDIRVVARMIEPPEADLPADWRIILARPPFSLDDEVALMRDEGVTMLVSKNAGGPARAKLDAARELGLPVIMIERPVKPVAKVCSTVDAVVAAITGEGK